MTNNQQGMCGKCRKRKTCKTPCAFVEDILKFENEGVYEKTNGDSITVYPRWREVQETVLQGKHEDSGKDRENNIFSTEAENPFASYEPKLDRTHVFINRFFKGMSYQDIATMMDDDPERIRGLYKDSVKRLVKALEVMDKRQAVVDDVKARLRISEKATGKLTKTQKWLLLNKVFGMLPREIAEMEGANVKTVCARIKDVHDRVVTGQVIFLNPSEDEIRAAQERIEKKRQRDRAA